MLLFAVSLCLADAPAVSVWKRAPGDYVQAPPARADARLVPLTPVERRKIRDHQYQRDVELEGVPLARLLSHRGAEDAAVLHFANGMAINVPLATLRTDDAFIATAICAPACSAELPIVAKKDTYYQDRRPIRFAGNKLSLPAAKVAADSPFRHVDSLVGVELVVGAAYDRQFDVGDAPELAQGKQLFHARCQACHGVRSVGASFGWDYVKPIALSTYRSPKSLAMHVRYREKDAPEKGIVMPAFPDLSNDDAAALWRLLDAFAKQPLRPYAP